MKIFIIVVTIIISCNLISQEPLKKFDLKDYKHNIKIYKNDSIIDYEIDFEIHNDKFIINNDTIDLDFLDNPKFNYGMALIDSIQKIEYEEK